MTVTITDILTGNKLSAEIEPATSADLKAARSPEFSFKWKMNTGDEVYKLRLTNNQIVLGLISITSLTDPQNGYNCVVIDNVEVGAINRGRAKRLEGIAGCLIAYACRRSFIVGCEGYVMLKSKTKLEKHYHSKYGFQGIGKGGSLATTMVLDTPASEALIKQYF